MMWATKGLSAITKDTLSFLCEVYFRSMMYSNVSSLFLGVSNHSQENDSGWHTACQLFQFPGLNSSFPISSNFLFSPHFLEACYFQDDKRHDNDEGEMTQNPKTDKGI